jgi:CRP-like cAMP-binding protein
MRLRGRRRQRETVAELRRVPLFAGVRDDDLERLGAIGFRRRFAEGEAIVLEGEQGAAFFVLLSGCAAVSVAGELVGALLEGDTFGESGAIGGRGRTATVVAATDIECLVLPPWSLRGFLATHGDVALALARRLALLASRPS